MGPQDGTVRNCHVRHTRVSERSLVSVHGILPESSSPLPVLVKRVTIIVQRSTRRSTISVMDSTPRTGSWSKTMHLPNTIWPINLSTQWEDSLTTERLNKI